MAVNKKMMEINKPSELCQIVCLDKNKNLSGSLTMTQLDIMNFLLYISRESIMKNKLSEIDEFYKIEVPLMEFNKVLNLNSSHVYHHIIKSLTELKVNLFVINALEKNKNIETTITSFVHKISYSKHKNNNKKIVKLVLDGDIIKSLIDTQKFFSKMFLKIQFSMNSKYSKLLYEVLKDYISVNTLKLDIEMIYALLNVDITKKTNTQWSTFRTNILEKAVNEINEKSDIVVSYEPIKEKIEGQRKQVTQVKFNIEKQPKARLEALGLLEPPITEHEFYHRSKEKLEKLKKSGYVIKKSEEGWINKDIEENKELYEAQNNLDDYLEKIKSFTPDEKFELFSEIAHFIGSKDPVVSIGEDYIIKDMMGNALTKSAIETREKIIEFQADN